MAVLNADDLDFFDRNGYVVIHDAVPRKNLDATIDALWEFLGMDRNDPNDWYREPHRTNGMVEIYQRQALWDNRQHPRIYEAFCDLFGTHRLWVSLDRACLKPPRHLDHPEYDHKGFIHWDADTHRAHLGRDGRIVLHANGPETDSDRPPVPFGVQGVLYLADTDVNQGGFQCIPGMHRGLDQWIAKQPPDRNPSVPDLTGLEVVPIAGRAGDFLIWDRLLPHGNGHNVSDKPRLAQFITMYPARKDDGEARQRRINCWRNRLPPGGKAFPGDPREWEKRFGETAELTPLGRKLLGLDLWDEPPA